MMGYRQFIKRLFPYIKGHIGKLAFTSLMMVFATTLEASIPEITGQIIDTLFEIQELALTEVKANNELKVMTANSVNE